VSSGKKRGSEARFRVQSESAFRQFLGLRRVGYPTSYHERAEHQHFQNQRSAIVCFSRLSHSEPFLNLIFVQRAGFAHTKQLFFFTATPQSGVM
jgi:hypothetical protein